MTYLPFSNTKQMMRGQQLGFAAWLVGLGVLMPELFRGKKRTVGDAVFTFGALGLWGTCLFMITQFAARRAEKYNPYYDEPLDQVSDALAGTPYFARWVLKRIHWTVTPIFNFFLDSLHWIDSYWTPFIENVDIPELPPLLDPNEPVELSSEESDIESENDSDYGDFSDDDDDTSYP
jgi:hypothetical protein